jgi:hypothetical protein
MQPVMILVHQHRCEETAMNVRIPNLSTPQRETLEKYLPVLLAIGVAWLCARGLRKMLWTAFGLFWAFRLSGMSHHLFH